MTVPGGTLDNLPPPSVLLTPSFSGSSNALVNRYFPVGQHSLHIIPGIVWTSFGEVPSDLSQSSRCALTDAVC